MNNKKGYNLYFIENDYQRWEEFCKYHFKTKRVLSKVLSEAMEEYIENFENIKNN